ncbi:hypothetical protein GCM10010371_27350 [Streptomyces subrutilus]|uniref:Tetracyclin repressor-like C-terminal domain-containing protein n=1 Tax=Streptomyces subrutilus TaxID=36818 RepID=A0A5P2UPL7_9ACTN|nr:hypothetical protein [Streptomyces subrutilus]QEU81043.1 hypothetical protein CP968_24585 [Streptomyces subrutilus]GGZ66140.1 hypothetical protein GCM10010371_27350 [Streptomyces subrutilus]
MLRDNATAYADPATPTGCMIVLAAPVCVPEASPVAEALARMRAGVRETIRARVVRGFEEGGVRADADAAAIAAFYGTVLNGLSVQSRDGAPAAELHSAVDGALASWGTLATPRTPVPTPPA